MQPLQQLWAQLIQYWQHLSLRDRWALGALGVFLLLVLLYAALIRPVHQYQQQALTRYKTNADLVSWIDQNRARLETPNVNQAQISNRRGRTSVAVLTESARDYQLAIARIEPKDQASVRIWLDNVKFNDLITWFGVLHEQYGIAIQEISVDQTETPGMVRANVIFRG